MTRWMDLRCVLGAAVCAVLLGAGATPAGAQQTGTVTGIVMDATSARPLAGAQVSIVNTQIGNITNEQGRYQLLNVPAGTHDLRVEFIGYGSSTRQITVTAGQVTTANLSLTASAIELNELVVTGVSGGAREKGKVPFTVARVSLDQMPVQATNPLSQLQGRVPGANIASVSGRPGVAPAVILRGPTSLNASGRSQEPLYIVDGVVLGSSIADLNPADIESVEVVKGAAASTLYGSRAASGVIAITTKRGPLNSDGVRFNARVEYGANDIESDFGIARYHTFLMDETGTRFCVLDAYGSSSTCARTIDYRAEIARINNAPGDFALTPPSFPVDPGAVTSGPILRRSFLANSWSGETHNAVSQLVKPQPLAINDFSATGRLGSTTFFTSFGFLKQEGAIQGLKGNERLNGRINLTHHFGDQFALDISSAIARSKLDGTNQEEGGTGFFRLTRTPAIADITQTDDLGRLNIRTNLASGGVQNENPLYSFDNVLRDDVRWRYILGSSLRYTPIDWFNADANFSLDRLNLNFLQFSNRGFRTTTLNPATNQGTIFNGVNNTQSINTSAGVTLQPHISNLFTNQFTVRALYEEQSFDARNIQGQFLRVSDVTSGANATQQQTISSSVSQTQQMSFSAGAAIDLLDRYEFDFALRRDGNSRFGADNRWQTYGRASAAWLLARESWFPAKSLSAFTLRGSYGTSGNTPSYSAQYETFTIGAGGTLTAATLGNPNLRPEVVHEIEVGGDIEINNRWGLTVAYADGIAKNQILPVPVPVATGFPTQWQNAGSMRNKTWEGALTLPILRNSNGLTWTARANYTRNRAVVEQLDVPPFFIGTNLQATGEIMRIEEGVRYGTFYGRTFMTGCSQLPSTFQSQCGTPTSAFQVNDEGYVVWVGQGNNPAMGITHNLWNATLPAAAAPYGVQAAWGMPILVRDENGSPTLLPLGHALPDYKIGTSQTVSYRKLSLYGLVEGAFGQSVYNQGRHWSYLDFLSHDVDQGGKSVESAKPIGYYYRAGPGPAGNANGLGGFYDILGPNNRFVEDASFIKLRELSVSYNVGQISNFGNWTASLIGRNLKTWTDYTGFDPEVGANSSGGQSGSGLINAIDAFTFPQLRTFSFVLSTTF